MTTRRRGMTLAEHEALLKAEGRYDAMVAAHRKRDEELQRREEEFARAEAPLLDDLRKAGVHVTSAWDLVNSENTYDHVLPILLGHLARPYPDAVREGIARALAVPAAQFAWPVLVDLYKKEQGRQTKDGLAVAIANTVNSETIDELIGLAKDTVHGSSRLLLLSGLKRSRLERARQALVELEDDPDLTTEVRVILRRRRQSPR